VSKILITGGAGFIGYHLSKYLLGHGNKIDIVDNFSRAVKDPELETLISDPDVNAITMDLLEPGALDALADDYDYIYHLAAIIGVANVFERPYSVLDDNVRLTSTMLEFATRQKNLKRFMFASTSEVYAGTLKHFTLELPSPESTALAVTDLTLPRTSYMLSKIYGEAMCNMSPVPTTNFRPHNIYGPRMGMAHVIPELLKKAYTAEPNSAMEVFSVDHKRTFCYIDDAVKMLELMAESDNCENETVNLGIQTPEITMGEVADIVIETVGIPLTQDPQPATAGSPARRCPDMTKLTGLIGFKAEVGPKEGISRTFDWHKETIFDAGGITAK